MAHEARSIAAIVKVVTLTALIIGLVITPFMLIVWKQVYISGSALRQGALTDSITTLKSTIAARTLVAGQLASTARIERIARAELALDYPTAAQIVVVRIGDSRTAAKFDLPFFAAFRRTFLQSRG